MDADQSPPDGVIRVPVPAPLAGGWTRNGDLLVTVVRPPPVAFPQMLEDASRTDAVALATALLSPSPDGGRAPLLVSGTAPPQIVVFPELAFGWPDHDALDRLIRALPADVVVLAGFGYTSGERLNAAAASERIRASWTEPLDPYGAHNGAWCWIHGRDGRTECHVLLKNWPEQSMEKALVADFAEGRHILRLDAGDLTIFPLICADLVHKGDEDSETVRARIRRSLKRDPPGTNVLIVAMLFTDKPSHNAWRTAIDDVVGIPAGPVVLLVNGAPERPSPEEADDRWRTLTGAFLDHGRMGAPRLPLPHVRFVSTQDAHGLVLRDGAWGSATGPLRWKDDATGGRYVWSPNALYAWRGGALARVQRGAAGFEILRILARRRADLAQGLEPPIVGWLDEQLQKMREDLLKPDPAGMFALALFRSLLHGLREERRDEIASPDDLAEDVRWADALVEGLRAAATVRGALHTDSGTVEGKQLLFATTNPEWRLLVWRDPFLTMFEMYKCAERAAAEGGSGAPLVVIGRGKGPTYGAPGRIRPRSVADAPSNPGERDITEPRARVVIWRRMDDVEGALRERDGDALQRSVKQTLEVPEEA